MTRRIAQSCSAGTPRLALRLAAIMGVVLILALGGAESAAQTDPPAPRSDFAFSDSGQGRITGALQKGELGLLFDSTKRRDGTTTVLKDMQQQELLRVEIDDRSGLVETTIFGGSTPVMTESMVGADGDDVAAWNLAINPNYQLLPELSRALGQSGRTGKDYPATMPVHLLALGIANYLALTQEPIVGEPDDECGTDGVVYRWDGDWLRPNRLTFEGLLVVEDSLCLTSPSSGAPTPVEEAWREACQPSCMERPNPDDDCFGMCGPGCECWRWVCGDCCYHAICAEHDREVRDCAELGLSAFATCIEAVPTTIFGLLGLGCSG